MRTFRPLAALTLVLLLALGAAALAIAGPAHASAAKQTCLKPIDAAYQHTRTSLGTSSSGSRGFLAEEAGGEINNAINDCLLQPGKVNANLEKAKNKNAAAVKIYEGSGNSGQATMLQRDVLRFLVDAEDAVR